MRDILVTLIIFGSLPVILFKPQVGILMWAWISYMNPHRLTYGFAFDMPFGEIVALVTLVAWLLSREPKTFPVNTSIAILMIFAVWVSITAYFALEPADALVKWEQVIKVLFMTFVTMALMRSRERIDALVWVIVVSIGFFAIKGGIFTAVAGGKYQVWGPPRSFISDNNQLALATVMVIPLMRYLQLQSKRRWVRWGLSGAMLLSVFSVLASYSRGAFLALVIMAFFLGMKSRKRLLFGALIVVALGAAIIFMPEQWADRIATIQDYKSDQSAQDRINAWTFAYNLAKDHPIMGGGFGAFHPALYAIYAPNPNLVFNAHSIYFEVLGEQGFVGLAIFLLLGASTFFAGGWTIRHARRDPELGWCRDLSAMLQVGLIGYAVAGAFLNMAFFDLLYDFVALTVLTQAVVRQKVRVDREPARLRPGAPMRPRGPVPDPLLAGRIGRAGAGRSF